MELTLIPLVGPFHLRFPGYNAASVKGSIAAFRPEALALTPLPPGSLDSPSWQDTAELALPLTVVPWARQQGLPLYPVHVPSPDPEAPADFRRYLEGYPEQRGALQEVDAALRPVSALLETPLDLSRIQDELLPALRVHQELREARLEEGPATDWLRGRVTEMAERILALPHDRVAVPASAEHIPFLEDALAGKAELRPPPESQPSDEVRERSLLDVAFRGDSADPGQLIARLRELTSLEARYHEANLLLGHGHLAEALELLENASHGDFHRPYYLPGYLLARLGQLRDLAGERQAALRAYRGVLALDWVPQEAREAAEAGLAAPFEGLGEQAQSQTG